MTIIYIIVVAWRGVPVLDITSFSQSLGSLLLIDISSQGVFRALIFFKNDGKFEAGFCCCFSAGFWGIFAVWFQKWNVIDEWDMAQPFCSQQGIPHPSLTQYYLPIRFIPSLLPLCSPCQHLWMLRTTQNGIFPLKFYPSKKKSAPVPCRKTLEPSMTQEHWRWGRKNHFLQLPFLHGKTDTIKWSFFGAIPLRKAAALIFFFLQKSSLLPCVRLLHVVHPNPMTSTRGQTLRTNPSAHFCIEFHSQSLDLLTL